PVRGNRAASAAGGCRRIRRGDCVFCGMLPDRTAAGSMSAARIGGGGGVDARAARGARIQWGENRMLEVGVLFWADRDDLATIRAFGVSTGQMVVPGPMPLDQAAAAHWKTALSTAQFTLVTVFAAYEGE